LFKRFVSFVAASQHNSAVATRPGAAEAKQSAARERYVPGTPLPPPEEPEKAEVFTMGSLRSGCLGNGISADSQPDADPLSAHCCHSTPGTIPELRGRAIVRLSLGACHGAALDTAGRLWSWGRNDSGQLGNGDYAPLWRPTLLKGYGEFWAEVSCGEEHTLAIGFDNNVYAWGSNRNGQLSFPSGSAAGGGNGSAGATEAQQATATASGGEWNAPCPAPKLVTSLFRKGVTRVRAGRHHSVCLTEDGDAWTTRILDGAAVKQSGVQAVRFYKLQPSLSLVDVVATPLDTNLAVDAQGVLHRWEHNVLESDEASSTRDNALETRRVAQIDAGLEHVAVLASITRRWRKEASDNHKQQRLAGE